MIICSFKRLPSKEQKKENVKINLNSFIRMSLFIIKVSRISQIIILENFWRRKRLFYFFWQEMVNLKTFINKKKLFVDKFEKKFLSRAKKNIETFSFIDINSEKSNKKTFEDVRMIHLSYKFPIKINCEDTNVYLIETYMTWIFFYPSDCLDCESTKNSRAKWKF